MYYSGKNPLAKVARYTEDVDIVKGEKRRRLHKAFLRYHDANNWPMLRDALKEMGRADLIGNSKQHLIPTYQPQGTGEYQSARKKNSSKAGDSVKRTGGQSTSQKAPQKGQILTQHTGLPPREQTDRSSSTNNNQAKKAQSKNAQGRNASNPKQKPSGKKHSNRA